nr:hypothetical protein [Actinomyces israelii]
MRFVLDAVLFSAPSDCELPAVARRPVPLDVDLLVLLGGARSVAAISSDVRRASPPLDSSLVSPPVGVVALSAEGSSRDSGKKTSVGRADGVSVCVSGIRA